MFQVGSIFCSRLELLSRTAAGNRAYVSGRHNTTSRRIHTWFLFISQRTLRETSRIFAWKFASNFRVDRIVARKFAAYYRTPWSISRKFARIKTIDVAKSQRKIANCRRDFFSSEISSKSANFAEVRLHYFFTILYLSFRRRQRPHCQKHSVKAAAVRIYSFSLADVKVNFISYEESDLTIFFCNR